MYDMENVGLNSVLLVLTLGSIDLSYNLKKQYYHVSYYIRDAAGAEKYRSLVCSYYRGAQGVFIVYDITNSNSLFKLNDWIKDVENFSDLNAVKILIGSKCDDKSNRAISIEEGQKIAERFGIPFFEVSSKTNVNIDKLLYTMISRIDDLQKQPTDINKELMHTNDTMKPKLDSDVKPNTIPVHCPKMKKEIPDIANTKDDDSQHYKLRRVQPEVANEKFKLIIVGHTNVGKSTIINHFCNGVYQDTVPTADMDFHEIFVKFENETIHLNIWDTGGTEKHRSLAHSYYEGAHGVFIAYDITDLKSLYQLDGWIKDIEKFSNVDAVKILIGNKCDDKTNRETSIKEGQEIAEVYGIPFFEVSSKSNINIDKLLYTMISDCIKKEHYKLIRVQPDRNTINKKYKLIIVGPSNVGKSTIIHRLCKNIYEDTIKTTISMDYHEIFVTFKNKTIQLIIRDTAGTEKYRSLADSYYRGAQGVFIVYDITNSNSLFKLNDWIKDVENFSELNAVKILIGSKCDDKSNRAISIEEGQKIAERFGIPFFEVSSKTNVNIDKLLYTMISKIHELEPGAQQTIDEDLIILNDNEEKKDLRTNFLSKQPQQEPSGCWC